MQVRRPSGLGEGVRSSLNRLGRGGSLEPVDLPNGPIGGTVESRCIRVRILEQATLALLAGGSLIVNSDPAHCADPPAVTSDPAVCQLTNSSWHAPDGRQMFWVSGEGTFVNGPVPANPANECGAIRVSSAWIEGPPCRGRTFAYDYPGGGRWTEWHANIDFLTPTLGLLTAKVVVRENATAKPDTCEAWLAVPVTPRATAVQPILWSQLRQLYR